MKNGSIAILERAACSPVDAVYVIETMKSFIEATKYICF